MKDQAWSRSRPLYDYSLSLVLTPQENFKQDNPCIVTVIFLNEVTLLMFVRGFGPLMDLNFGLYRSLYIFCLWKNKAMSRPN